MIDREKVIKELGDLCEYMFHEYKVCYHGDENDTYNRFLTVNNALNLLKEQEPKAGHWIFESRYCEAWSHTCSECGKRMTTAVGMYASFCWNCGAKMTGGDSSSSETPNS